MAAYLKSSGNFALNIYLLDDAPQASARRSKSSDEPGTLSLPLHKLDPGPWRSLGGFLDYSAWPERDRFAELDRAIEAAQEHRPTIRAEAGPMRRCRAKIADGANCNEYFSAEAGYDGWKCEAHRDASPAVKPVNSWRQKFQWNFDCSAPLNP